MPSARPRRRIGRLLKIGAIGFGLLAIAIQFIPFGRDHTNPPVRVEPAWDSPQTRALFFRACADCHSNQTIWPWYSHIAPVSWQVQRDIQEGRAAFNISEWDREDQEGDDAADKFQDGEMPPLPYLLAHSSARLSAAERQAFIAGLVATFGDEREDAEDDAEDRREDAEDQREDAEDDAEDRREDAEDRRD
jgi:hypothetical protein